MAAKTRFAVVNNVNTARSRHADFDIHVEGCKALAKLDPRDIEIIEARHASEVERLNNEEIRGSGSFDEDSMWPHRTHSCVPKVPTGRTGATGPRYTDEQIREGHRLAVESALRGRTMTNREIADAVGVKSPSYFAKVRRTRGAALTNAAHEVDHSAAANEAVRENNEKVMAAEAAAAKPRKWTVEVAVAGQDCLVVLDNVNDTLKDTTAAGIEAARSMIADEQGSDGSVVLFKQLKGDAEPKRDRAVYVYRDDDGSIKTQNHGA
jgi:hypothetical protein